MKSLTALVIYYLTYAKINIYNFTNENENLSSMDHLIISCTTSSTQFWEMDLIT